MLGVFFGYLVVSMFFFFVESRYLRCMVYFSSSMLVFISALMYSSGRVILGGFYLDSISYPLLVLSSLMVFLSIVASYKNLSLVSELESRGFLFCLLSVGFFLFPCFLMKSFLGFFLFFEASVLPLMVLMTRWGSQKARVQASVYFVFYTMFGSFPLLVFFMSMYLELKSSFMGLDCLLPGLTSWEVGGVVLFGGSSLFVVLSWAGILGFLMKLPVYGFHLWLPKAHVEAPVAGSMLLAALLLKLGGYGLIRVGSYVYLGLGNYIITFCFFGSLAASMICLRQTDLKSLMAFSSVGHMSLVAGGVLLKSVWSISGALMLMISHGLISSCLFATANLVYERSGTRTLSLTRGLSGVSGLMSLWWLLACASNLGLPPLPSFIGEILLVLCAVDSSWLYVVILGLSLVFSSIYSLFIYQKTCSGRVTTFFLNFKGFSCREHFLIFVHLFPLLLILGNPGLCLCL